MFSFTDVYICLYARFFKDSKLDGDSFSEEQNYEITETMRLEMEHNSDPAWYFLLVLCICNYVLTCVHAYPIYLLVKDCWDIVS